MNKIIWKIVNDDGNSINGFSSEVEAIIGLTYLRTDKQWRIVSYPADDIEINY